LPSLAKLQCCCQAAWELDSLNLAATQFRWFVVVLSAFNTPAAVLIGKIRKLNKPASGVVKILQHWVLM
jgi:hypothetical protein